MLHNKCLALSCLTEDSLCKALHQRRLPYVELKTMPDIWWGSGHREMKQPSRLAKKHKDVHEHVMHAKHLMSVSDF